LLQGYEVKALEVVTSITQTDTAALLHDGWVTYSNHDKGVFEKAIFEQTGLHLSVEFEIVKPTIEQPFNSAADLASNDVKEIENSVACKLIDRVKPPCVYSLELITPLVDPLLIKHQLTLSYGSRHSQK
jgi:hypothetical protein